MQRMGWAARIVWRATVVIGLVTTAATLTAPSNAFAVSEPTVAPKASPSPAAVGTVVQLGEKVKGSTGAFAYRWSLLAQPFVGCHAHFDPRCARHLPALADRDR
jgi:cytochrome c5